MNFPDNFESQEPIGLKLSIKSSLPRVKAALALAYFLWQSSNQPYSLNYAEEYIQKNNDIGLKLRADVYANLVKYLKNLIHDFDEKSLSIALEKNGLLTAQMEQLLVPFELVWKIAIFEFENKKYSFSVERQTINGIKVRYKKIMKFTRNLDHLALLANNDANVELSLYNWLINKSKADDKRDASLIKFLTLISEDTIYRLRVNAENDIKFIMPNAYDKLVEDGDVNLTDYSEGVGPLRVMGPAIKDGLNYYIHHKADKHIMKPHVIKEDLANYSNRSKALFSLSHLPEDTLKELSLDSQGDDDFVKSDSETVANPSALLQKPIQKIFYGAPGTGKSYKVTEIIKKREGLDSTDSIDNLDNVLRTTIYPEYSYSDFVGQVMPVVRDNTITYEFKRGIFTDALLKAFSNPDTNIYLVIEEMSRGNISSVFGDTFQLLDRNKDGISEYAINNDLISKELNQRLSHTLISDNQFKKVYIPSNLSIIGTLNTSDQNVFVMDTAFKRRFDFEYISVKEVFGENKQKLNNFTFMCNGNKVSWIEFYKILNDYIINEAELHEDKQVGQFFIKGITTDSNDFDLPSNTDKIKNKLLQYLWNDVNDMIFDESKKIFNPSFKSYSQVYENFSNPVENIFNFNYGDSIIE